MISQFIGPYSPVRPAKNFKLVLLQNCFVIYRQVFLAFIARKSLKLSFTLNCVLKRVSDLKNDFKLIRFASRNLKPFRVDRNHS